MNDELNEKLIRAVKIGYLEGVQRLLVEGANPNAKGSEKASALDWAEVLFDTQGIKNMLEASCKSYAEEKKQSDEQEKKHAADKRNERQGGIDY